MFNNNIYIANNDVKPDLPQFDMSEIPPLPAFQMQSDMPIEQPTPFYFTSNFMMGALILFSIVCFLLAGYISKKRKQAKLRKRWAPKQKAQLKKPLPVKQDKPVEIPIKNTDVKSKQPVAKPVEKSKGQDAKEGELQEAFSLKKAVLKDEAKTKAKQQKETVDEKEEVIIDSKKQSIMKLGTPSSVQKCIKNFLEITIEA